MKSSSHQSKKYSGYICVKVLNIFVSNFRFKDVESALIESYDIILRGSTEIPRFESVLEPDEDEKPVCLKPTILKEIIEKARNYELEDF